MIGIVNDIFSLIPFTATIGNTTYLVRDKVIFEKNYLQQLRYEGFRNAMERGERISFDDIEVTLPLITYTENTLTPEQDERLTIMNTFSSLPLDDARNYILHDIEPTHLEYTTRQLETKNKNLSNQVLSVMEVSATLYEEKEALKLQNLELMSAMADIYESMMGGAN